MADGRKMGKKILFLAPGIHSYLHCQIRLQGKHCPHLPLKGWALVNSRSPWFASCFSGSILPAFNSLILVVHYILSGKPIAWTVLFPLPLLNHMLNDTFFSPIPLSLYFTLIPQKRFYSSTFYVVLTHMSTYVYTYIHTYSHTQI